MKNHLGIDSEAFLNEYCGALTGPNPYFPAIVLRMQENDEKTCPFLEESGCRIYEARPSACRTYPLERALEKKTGESRLLEHYFVVKHPYCRGHEEEKQWLVKEWVRDQRLGYYNHMDELWAEMDALFRQNPWQGEGAAGPLQQTAFMVCYNPDGFRRYIEQFSLLGQFKLEKERRKAIMTDDETRLRFGYDWLKYILTGQTTLKPQK